MKKSDITFLRNKKKNEPSKFVNLPRLTIFVMIPWEANILMWNLFILTYLVSFEYFVRDCLEQVHVDKTLGL